MTERVDHPYVPNWQGDRAWTAPGEEPSDFLTFEAGDMGGPFSIEHDREMMFDGGQLAQDYNVIVYSFGDPAAPIRARHYLSDDRVGVILPDLSDRADLEEGRRHLPEDVLAYLQRRFDAVDLLTRDGYCELWSIER